MNNLRKNKCRKNQNSKGNGVALGITFGSAFGTVMFSITGVAYWISIGLGVGIAFSPLITKLYNNKCDNKEKSEL